MSVPVLYDPLGPRGRRRVLIASIVSGSLIALLVAYVLWRFATRDQLDQARWRPFTMWSTWRFLLVGLRNTVAATAVAGSLAITAGLGLALLRLSRRRILRVPTGAWIQFFRGVPLLLLIFFLARFFGQRGIEVSAFWILVLGLTIYNAAVFAEVFRAGILSLDRGQRDAGAAIGLRPWQAMRLVVLPQAIQRMLPTLVSQLVILLKDTSLGFVLPYEELLRRGRSIGEIYPASILQALIVVAGLYLSVNVALSRVAARLERRQTRRFGEVWTLPEHPGAAPGTAVPAEFGPRPDRLECSSVGGEEVPAGPRGPRFTLRRPAELTEWCGCRPRRRFLGVLEWRACALPSRCTAN